MNIAELKPFILRNNGLIIPADFPTQPYEEIYSIIEKHHARHVLYEHYSGAWSALSYRFRSLVEHGDTFVALVGTYGATPPPEERYLQEKALYEFFSAGFSAIECVFYGLYSIGAVLSPKDFPLASPKDQQQVSPSRTKSAFSSAFPDDQILNAISGVFADPGYQRFREVRNVLTHRAAPGRRMYVSIGGEEEIPTEWKLNDTPLDVSIATEGRREMVRLLTTLLAASANFAKVHFK